jgi:hypothetical protein
MSDETLRELERDAARGGAAEELAYLRAALRGHGLAVEIPPVEAVELERCAALLEHALAGSGRAARALEVIAADTSSAAAREALEAILAAVGPPPCDELTEEEEHRALERLIEAAAKEPRVPPVARLLLQHWPSDDRGSLGVVLSELVRDAPDLRDLPDLLATWATVAMNAGERPVETLAELAPHARGEHVSGLRAALRGEPSSLPGLVSELLADGRWRQFAWSGLARRVKLGHVVWPGRRVPPVRPSAQAALAGAAWLLAALAQAGVETWNELLGAAAPWVARPELRAAFTAMAKELDAGEAIGDLLAARPELFPPALVELLNAADLERSARLLEDGVIRAPGSRGAAPVDGWRSFLDGRSRLAAALLGTPEAEVACVRAQARAAGADPRPDDGAELVRCLELALELLAARGHDDAADLPHVLRVVADQTSSVRLREGLAALDVSSLGLPPLAGVVLQHRNVRLALERLQPIAEGRLVAEPFALLVLFARDVASSPDPVVRVDQLVAALATPAAEVLRSVMDPSGLPAPLPGLVGHLRGWSAFGPWFEGTIALSRALRTGALRWPSSSETREDPEPPLAAATAALVRLLAFALTGETLSGALAALPAWAARDDLRRATRDLAERASRGARLHEALAVSPPFPAILGVVAEGYTFEDAPLDPVTGSKGPERLLALAELIEVGCARVGALEPI